MRIAQIATCSGPVREDQTGSVESLVWLLSRELTALGHDVTVYGCAGSQSAGQTVITVPGAYGDNGAPADWQVCEWVNLGRALRDAGNFDVIHSHVYLWGLPLDDLTPKPVVHTMHTCPYEDEAVLRGLYPGATVTAISHHQWRGIGELPPAAVIHHGVDIEQFTFQAFPDRYVCYLGRFIPGKGPLEAISAARNLGIPIVLAGPVNEYFEVNIRPLVNGREVRFIGPVNRQQRDALLGGARALLYPLTEPEPFGLVQVEAMLCGTPVVATAIGAVPEVVRDGVSGILAASMADLPRAAELALQLNRSAVRLDAAARFGARSMAENYLRVYQSLVERIPLRSNVRLPVQRK